ncbi:hypothetical protein CCP4SC76_1920003 [Gammaproteobacteria bacterium]
MSLQIFNLSVTNATAYSKEKAHERFNNPDTSNITARAS